MQRCRRNVRPRSSSTPAHWLSGSSDNRHFEIDCHDRNVGLPDGGPDAARQSSAPLESPSLVLSVMHRQDHDTLVKQVQDYTQIQLALLRLDLGDVGDPLSFWLQRSEVPLQPVTHARGGGASAGRLRWPRRLGRGQPCKPSPAINRATRLRLTDSPSSTRSSRIRSAPNTPRLSSCSSRMRPSKRSLSS